MTMPDILATIMAWKRQELAARKAQVPRSRWEAQAAAMPPPPDFACALRPTEGERAVRLIAEIKKASPSRGLLCPDFDPRALAETYARHGAAAISCLTDERFFQGRLEHLIAAREHLEALGMPRPFLRKDFVFDPYQVVEARAAGASAVLLIVAALEPPVLRRLIEEARAWGLTPLVEVHDEEEVAQALDAGATVVGINNRDLRTFHVDLRTTERLRTLIPEDIIVVSESGIHTPEDVRRLRDMGVDAILVGEALVKAAATQRGSLVAALVDAGRAPTEIQQRARGFVGGAP